MLKSIIQLFRIARKLAASGAVNTINEVYEIPFAIKIFFYASSMSVYGDAVRKENY